MYFLGEFDGKTFTADELDYPLWLDYGMDNYAGVTWSNTGDRKVMIGWMNNWQYAGTVPCSPWRSAMTLPRELKLINYDKKTLLATTVVSEIDKIADNWKAADGDLDVKDAYQLRITVSLDQNSTSNGSSYVDNWSDILQWHLLCPVSESSAQCHRQRSDTRYFCRPIIGGSIHSEWIHVDDQSRIPQIHLQPAHR